MAYHNNTQRVLAPYTSYTKLGDLVCTDYSLLLIANRYGIQLGFGDRTIGQVCEAGGLDLKTLLLILNLSVGEFDFPNAKQMEEIDIDSLIRYLSNSHSYFLDYRLPGLRPRLLSAISNCPDEVAVAIRHFYDEYVEEVRKHMDYEERTVFPYVRKLAQGQLDKNYSIKIYRKRHDQIELKITELKNLLIRYYPAPSSYELGSVLNEIFSSESELAAHNLIEDNLFTPYVVNLEQRLIREAETNPLAPATSCPSQLSK